MLTSPSLTLPYLPSLRLLSATIQIPNTNVSSNPTPPNAAVVASAGISARLWCQPSPSSPPSRFRSIGKAIAEIGGEACPSPTPSRHTNPDVHVLHPSWVYPNLKGGGGGLHLGASWFLKILLLTTPIRLARGTAKDVSTTRRPSCAMLLLYQTSRRTEGAEVPLRIGYQWGG